MDFTIVPLSEKPEFADCCAAWSFGEWGSQTIDAGIDRTIRRYRDTAGRTGGLPATWVAVVNDHPAGMASLKADDHPDETVLSPWFASLFVHPLYRGMGLARTLLSHVETEAKKTFGYSRLYLYTGNAVSLYELQGWKKMRNVRDPMGIMPDGDVLMYKELA